jgi:hypothetical protein
MASDALPELATKLAALKPKTKVPNSANVLNTWISLAERHLPSPVMAPPEPQ